jgi:GH25 family lysozyme M1 (1,4-beta-N-acetylmuramidase)
MSTSSPLVAPRSGWLLGVDTGLDQGLLDVPALQAAGVAFGYHRATDGIHDIDPQWTASSKASADAGLPFGAYGILEPYTLDKVAAQASHFCDVVRDSGATLAPWCDFELAHGESGLAALQAAAAWCDSVEQSLGIGVVVYTGPSFVETLERYAGPAADEVLVRLARRPLAVADYGVAKPAVPPPWRTPDGDGWTIWQASGDGAAKLPWAPHRDVDVDWFRGTVADLVALGQGQG